MVKTMHLENQNGTERVLQQSPFLATTFHVACHLICRILK